MKLKVTTLSNPNPDKNNNEDFIGWHNHFFWVLDGASVPNGLVVPSEIDTHWYVSKLDEGIKKAISTLTEPFDLKDVLKFGLSQISLVRKQSTFTFQEEI